MKKIKGVNILNKGRRTIKRPVPLRGITPSSPEDKHTIMTDEGLKELTMAELEKIGQLRIEQERNRNPFEGI